MDNYVDSAGNSQRSVEVNGTHTRLVALDLNPHGPEEILARAQQISDFLPAQATTVFGALAIGLDDATNTWVPVRASPGFGMEVDVVRGHATGYPSGNYAEVSSTGRRLVAPLGPAEQSWRRGAYTTAQTGTALWTPAAGDRVAITHAWICAHGTTAGRVVLWFGAAGDTAYTEGTDQPVWDGEVAPSATLRENIYVPGPVYAATADHVLRVTTDAAVSARIVVYGYEF